VGIGGKLSEGKTWVCVETTADPLKADAGTGCGLAAHAESIAQNTTPIVRTPVGQKPIIQAQIRCPITTPRTIIRLRPVKPVGKIVEPALVDLNITLNSVTFRSVNILGYFLENEYSFFGR
jgi:hypothetical protein